MQEDVLNLLPVISLHGKEHVNLLVLRQSMVSLQLTPPFHAAAHCTHPAVDGPLGSRVTGYLNQCGDSVINLPATSPLHVTFGDGAPTWQAVDA